MTPVSPHHLEHAILDTVAVLSFLSDYLTLGPVTPLRREAAEGLGVILRDCCERLSTAWATRNGLPEQQD